MASTFETRIFINNEYVEAKSRDVFTIHSPADGTLISDQVHSAGEQDIDAAVDAAQNAFKGSWGRQDPTERAKAMFKFADLIREKAQDLARLDTLAMGSAISTQTMGYRIAADLFTYYAGLADKIHGEAIYPTSTGPYKIVQREPIGVCAGIGAWNVSSILFAWKVAPALAAGNTSIFKPSEKAPLGVLALGSLIKECFPPGTINIVNGAGKTGSTGTGRKIQEYAAKSNLKRVSLELGGKSPSIIFEDADVELAAAKTAESTLMNTGQICAMASRVYIHETIADDFILRLKKAFDAVDQRNAIGDPLAETTEVGPLADQAQFDRVLSFLEIGKTDGELVIGGARRGQTGLFVQPTVFKNVGRESRIAKEEVFGPVITVQVFQTEEEAIKLANDTVYGLSACLYTKSIARALRVSREIETGSIAINDWYFPSLGAPFGGVKQSGYGREGGLEGLNDYLQTKTIQININTTS